MGAEAPPPPRGPATPATPGEVPVPKQRPTWLVASGTAVIGLAVGIGIGWSLHHSKSCTTSNATVVPVGGNSSTVLPSSSASSNGAAVPGGTAGSAGSSSSAGTATDTAAAPTTAVAAVPSASGSVSATPSSGSTGASVSSGASGSASAPSSPNTPPTPYPTSAQQAESQMSDIVKQQVTNANAAGQLNKAISTVEAAQPGSGAYNQAIGQLNGLVTTELDQGQITSGTATALRQQVTYLLSFSGS